MTVLIPAVLHALIAAVLAPLPSSPTPTEPVAPAAEQAAAEKLFRQGVSDYDAHNYAAAIAAFQAAFKLSHAPEILFDIGQAYRALGDCRQAMDNFDAFVAAAAADDPLLPRARAKQDELRSCASDPDREQPKRRPKPPADLAVTALSVPAPTPTLQLQPPPPQTVIRDVPRPISRAVCFAGAGSALTLGGAGAVLAGKAHSLQVQVDRSQTWDDETKRADERGRTYGSVSLALLVSAGASAAVAAAACWVGWRASR